MCKTRGYNKTNHWLGGFLVVVGVVWFLTKAGVIPGGIWVYFWPVVLVLAGLHLVLRGCGGQGCHKDVVSEGEVGSCCAEKGETLDQA